jgi:hypothetical protein
LNILLRLAAIHLPAAFARHRLEQLFAVSAHAFGSPAPSIRGLSYDESLAVFAVFTRDQAEACLGRPGGVEAVRSRLFAGSREIGLDLRRRFRVTTGPDVAIALRVAYRALGIAFDGRGYGNVAIPRCFFSSYYSGPVCRVVAALDQGLAAGLSQGGRLTFVGRITEGSAACRAILQPPSR